MGPGDAPGRLSAPASAGGIQGLEPEPRSRKHIDYLLELRAGHGLQAAGDYAAHGDIGS
jgi:hypothetical protein